MLFIFPDSGLFILRIAVFSVLQMFFLFSALQTLFFGLQVIFISRVFLIADIFLASAFDFIIKKRVYRAPAACGSCTRRRKRVFVIRQRLLEFNCAIGYVPGGVSFIKNAYFSVRQNAARGIREEIGKPAEGRVLTGIFQVVRLYEFYSIVLYMS